MFRKIKEALKAQAGKSKSKGPRRYHLETGNAKREHGKLANIKRENVKRENVKREKKPISQNAFQAVGDEVLAEKVGSQMLGPGVAATGAKTKDEALSVYAKIRARELAETVTLKESKGRRLGGQRRLAGWSQGAAA